MAHDESLAQREFERINRALELFPVVQDILLKEAAQRAFYQSDPPSPIDALCNTHLASPEIIPTLVALLPQVKHPRVKEAIVRALTVKEARGIANSALIEQLRQVPWSAELHQEYLTLAVAHRELGDFDKLPVEMRHRPRTLAPWESLLSAFGNALWYLARRENLPYLWRLCATRATARLVRRLFALWFAFVLRDCANCCWICCKILMMGWHWRQRVGWRV